LAVLDLDFCHVYGALMVFAYAGGEEFLSVGDVGDVEGLHLSWAHQPVAGVVGSTLLLNFFAAVVGAEGAAPRLPATGSACRCAAPGLP
jgi:hypothetical protein